MGILGKLFNSRDDATPVHVDDSNFRDEVLAHSGPLILDVWGPGCAPCQRLVPVMASLAKEHGGRVKVCELNAAEAPKSASRLGVRGTPTVVVYKRKAEIGRLVGYHPKSYFTQMIEAEFGDEPEAPATATPVPVAVGDETLSKKARKKREKKARQAALAGG